jgi:hypothetical protein
MSGFQEVRFPDNIALARQAGRSSRLANWEGAYNYLGGTGKFKDINLDSLELRQHEPVGNGSDPIHLTP